MPFISYAQNFEDITLWRTFRLLGAGQYIDVGANHPTRDSVTRSLYERGWRGINIEPVEHYFRALCEERPEDINLCVAVGSEKKKCIFYENPETGLSTLEKSFADEKRKEGITFTERTVETLTLDAVCEEHLHKDIDFHFIKIDVEGFELEVLKGFDLRRWRPWLILIECAFNLTPAWEPIIKDAGYVFAKCDGVNKYYVAEERLELLNPLSLQPNILDDFYLCEGHLLSYPNDPELHPHCQHAKCKSNSESSEHENTTSPRVSETTTLMLISEILKRIVRKLHTTTRNHTEH